MIAEKAGGGHWGKAPSREGLAWLAPLCLSSVILKAGPPDQQQEEHLVRNSLTPDPLSETPVGPAVCFNKPFRF